MTGQEILTKVEIPIAMPLIISGIRSATLQIVSTATIAALVSLGGLGRYVIDGLKLRDFPQMFTGARRPVRADRADHCLAGAEDRLNCPGYLMNLRHIHRHRPVAEREHWRLSC